MRKSCSYSSTWIFSLIPVLACLWGKIVYSYMKDVLSCRFVKIMLGTLVRLSTLPWNLKKLKCLLFMGVFACQSFLKLSLFMRGIYGMRQMWYQICHYHTGTF
jgi:hypothetical protein